MTYIHEFLELIAKIENWKPILVEGFMTRGPGEKH